MQRAAAPLLCAARCPPPSACCHACAGQGADAARRPEAVLRRLRPEAALRHAVRFRRCMRPHPLAATAPQRSQPLPHTCAPNNLYKSCRQRAKRAQAVHGPSARRSGTSAALFGIIGRWQGTQISYPALDWAAGGRGAQPGRIPLPVHSQRPACAAAPAPIDRRQLLPHPATTKQRPP